MDAGGFIEFESRNGAWYGTSRKKVSTPIHNDKVPILVTDIVGGKRIFDNTKNFQYIFVEVSKMETIRKRQERKMEDEENIEYILDMAKREMEVVP